MLPVLRRRDIVALAQRVAVEDGDHPAEALIGAEIHRFPDLSFARLAVADDAEDALRHAVEPRRAPEPRRDRQALAQRSGRRVEERKAKRRIGMAVDRRPDLAERHQVALRHRPALAVGLERDAEIGARGIKDRHRVPFAQDQPVGPRIVRLGRRPAHHAVHQHRDEMRERQRRRRMAAARRRGGADREPPQVDCLGMKEVREIGHRFFLFRSWRKRRARRERRGPIAKPIKVISCASCTERLSCRRMTCLCQLGGLLASGYSIRQRPLPLSPSWLASEPAISRSIPRAATKVATSNSDQQFHDRLVKRTHSSAQTIR